MPIYNIDNHRTPDRFGGYEHKVPEVVTADALFAKYLEMVARKDREAEREEMPKPALGSLGAQFQKAAGKTLSAPTIDFKQIIQSFTEHETESKYTAFKDYFKFINENHKPLAFSNIDYKEDPAPPELSQARFKSRDSANEYSSDMLSYTQLQKDLKPSLLDEDVLYKGENAIADCIDESHQFALIGDTNHLSPRLSHYLCANLGFLSSLKNKGFKHAVFEINQEFEKTAQYYAEGKIDRKTALHQFTSISLSLQEGNNEYGLKKASLNAKGILLTVDNCKSAGINFHFLDEQCMSYRPSTNSTYTRFDKHEEKLLNKIKERVGRDKTAIIYGIGHFGYDFSLIDQLRSESTSIDFHATLEDYKTYSKFKINRAYQADYVYIIEDQVLIKPYAKYGRDASVYQDKNISEYNKWAQNHEIELFRQQFMDHMFERMNAGKETRVSVDDVLQAARPYWCKLPELTLPTLDRPIIHGLPMNKDTPIFMDLRLSPL